MKTSFAEWRRRYGAGLCSLFLIVVATVLLGLIAGTAGCGNVPVSANATQIYTWYDLDAIRNNKKGNLIVGHYILMNDLDRNTPGYEELAGPNANDGEGWAPIGGNLIGGETQVMFLGLLEGQGYSIKDLRINRPGKDRVGLFGQLGIAGVVRNIGVVNADVTADFMVGALVGGNWGSVVNCYSSGNVSGGRSVGGLVAQNAYILRDSCSTATVTGDSQVGGLVGNNIVISGTTGSIRNCHATGNVIGDWAVGGLVGANGEGASITNSYATGSVTGEQWVGGLVAISRGTVSYSHYNYSEVLINGENVITIGALFHEDFEQWLTNGRFLDVNERLDQEDDYYVINDVSDLKQLLAFGQDESLRFRLKDDIDLGADPGFYIPYLAGELDGNGHKVSNLSLNSDFISGVGLFGHLTGIVSDLGVENVSVTGRTSVGGLVGRSSGTVTNSYSTGSVTGEYDVGGLVGAIREDGIVSNSHSAANVTGANRVGGLVGEVWRSTVSNSYSIGDVIGHDYVGGLAGYNAAGTIRRCYSHSTVSGNEDVGGLVGGQADVVEGGEFFSPYVWGSFWDTETSGQSSSRGGQGKTTAEMQDITTFTTYGWDIVLIGDYINETWYIDDGNDYPRLGWQYP